MLLTPLLNKGKLTAWLILTRLTLFPIFQGANCTTEHPLSVQPIDSSHSTVDVEGDEDDQWDYDQDDDYVDSDQQSCLIHS